MLSFAALITAVIKLSLACCPSPLMMGDQAPLSGSLLCLQRLAWGLELRSALIAVEQMQVPLSHTQWPPAGPAADHFLTGDHAGTEGSRGDSATSTEGCTRALGGSDWERGNKPQQPSPKAIPGEAACQLQRPP